MSVQPTDLPAYRRFDKSIPIPVAPTRARVSLIKPVREFQRNWRLPAIAWVLPPETDVKLRLVDREGNEWRPAALRVDGAVVLACDEPQNQDEQGEGPSFPWTVEAAQMWFGPLTPNRVPASLTGCRWCGIEPGGHCQRWKLPVGWHQWAQPTAEQAKARMLARRAYALAAKAVA